MENFKMFEENRLSMVVALGIARDLGLTPKQVADHINEPETAKLDTIFLGEVALEAAKNKERLEKETAGEDITRLSKMLKELKETLEGKDK